MSALPCPHLSISLHTAAILTGRSVRTWQRRIEEGLVPRLGDGVRALVPFEAVQQSMEGVPGEAANAWSAQDVQTLVRADQGEALAQAQMGSQFALLALRGAATATPPAPGHDAGRIAHYFLERAAEQAQADAMHWLGLLYAAGLGPTGDASDADADTSNNAMALMWIAKAAAHGHAIARQQLAALLPNVPNLPNLPTGGQA